MKKKNVALDWHENSCLLEHLRQHFLIVA